MYSRDIYVERACSVECKEASVLKMANIKNLFCFFLTLITCRAQTQSWENTKSRLQITLIHLDSKALNASYIKVKNNPHYNCLYNVTVDSIPGAGVEKGSHAYQMNVYHQETGVGVIPIQWPNAAVGTEANITVVEVPQSSEMLPASLRVSDVGMSDFLSVNTAESSTSPTVVYPQSYQNMNYSLMRLGNSWKPVWDYKDDEVWLVNKTDPQQLQIMEITPVKTTFFCYMCSLGLTQSLSTYSIDLLLHTDSDMITYSLEGLVADSQGTIEQRHNKTSDVLSYHLKFNVSEEESTVLSSGSLTSTSGTKAKQYLYKLESENSPTDVYINEIHFPRLDTSISDDLRYWVEIIGPASTNLSSYCLALSMYTPSDGKTENSACLRPPSGAVINSRGYFTWEIEASNDEMRTYLLKMNTTRYAIQLYKENQVSYQLLDKFQFILIKSMEGATPPTEGGSGSCVGPSEDQYCYTTTSAACNTLCLPEKLVLGTRSMGVSRCGIQKDPLLKEKGVEMSVWYVKTTTEKAWNLCSAPKAYLKRISTANSTVLVSSFADDTSDDSISHLPNLGLILMVFYNRPDQPEIRKLPLTGADLTLNSSVSSVYPLKEIEFTLTKSGVADSSSGAEGQVTATGATLSSQTIGTVYAVALIQYYSFLPSFNLSLMDGHIVDAVVYSLPQTELDITMVTKFMDMQEGAEDQGQIRFSKALNPSLLHKADQMQRNTDSWIGVSSEGVNYELDKVYVTQLAQKYIRIDRVGNNNSSSSYVQLQLPALSAQLTKVFPDGVPLKGLCLVVSQDVAASKAKSIKDFSTDDFTLQVGKTFRIDLTELGAGAASFHFSNGDSFINLFRELNSTDFCMKEFDIYDNPMNGSKPSSNDEVLLDFIKISYNVAGGYTGIPITDDSEAVRCNSQLAYFNAAFSSVSPGAGCPVPSHLYLYKVCHDRIGVASELDSVADFPTDYLYVYKLNSQNEIESIIRQKAGILKYQYNVAFSGSVDISSTDITSLALGWFPNRAPRVNDVVLNNTLSVMIFYPDEKLKADADARLASVLDTAVDHEKARRSTTYYKPLANDLRHCLLGCDRTEGLVDIISYDQDTSGKNDGICKGGFTAQYESVRINEINANTIGFEDIGEYVELKGPAHFEYATGLSIGMLEVKNNQVTFKYVIHIDGDEEEFDENGFFIIEHVPSLVNVTVRRNSTQSAKHLRFIPNVVGAVVLMWGAELVRGINDAQPVTDEHVQMKDLFLDIVIYANNLQNAHSSDATTLRSKFASSHMRSIQGPVAIEQTRLPNTTETISRCFCNDTWNMDCFEMSFEETRRKENSCPTAFSKSFTICLKVNKTEVFSTFEKMREFIRDTVVSSEACQHMSCLVSKYQIRSFEHCALGGTSQRWSFALGFPSQSLFDALSPAFTVNTLINKYPQLQISACEKEACPSASPDKAVTPPPPAEHKRGAALTAGIVVACLVVVVLIVVIAIVIRRRQKRLKNMSARFEANHDDRDDDDDATFLPDGRISFSNPWYNQMNANSNSSSGKEYQKLTHT